jgi:intracellular multiplication protein IcmL
MKLAVGNPAKAAPARASRPAQNSKAKPDPDALPLLKDEPELAHASLILRSKIVRERQYHLYRLTYVLSGLLAFSIFGNVVQAIRPNNPIVIGATADGRILPIVPLERPIMSSSAMSAWVANAVTNSLTISFATYRRDVQASQQYYTADGWQAFSSGLVSSKFLGSILSNKYNVYTVPKDAPTMISQPGAVDSHGVAYWIWQVPVIVTFESAVTKFTNEYTITVTVERVRETDNPTGLGITEFVEQ